MTAGKCSTGKTPYTNRRLARLALDKLLVRRAGHKTERTAYVCPVCGLWHLTSMGEKPERIPRMPPADRWRWSGSIEEDD